MHEVPEYLLLGLVTLLICYFLVLCYWFWYFKAPLLGLFTRVHAERILECIQQKWRAYADDGIALLSQANPDDRAIQQALTELRSIRNNTAYVSGQERSTTYVKDLWTATDLFEPYRDDPSIDTQLLILHWYLFEIRCMWLGFVTNRLSIVLMAFLPLEITRKRGDSSDPP